MSRIVSAGPRDAEILAALHDLSFSRPWQASEFAVLLGQPGIVGLIAEEPVASAGVVPAGFILLRAVIDEAEILTLAVTPEHRRRGTASRLLDEALAILRTGHITHWYLEVAADNPAARALYARHGFEICGQRPDYYGGGPQQAAADAIVMTRLLSP